MAIEFHCPYCTATVRVGDDASGKIGRCPKCETRLRVPTIHLTMGDEAVQQAHAEQPPDSTAPPTPAIPIPAEQPPEKVPFLVLNAPANPQTLGQLPVVPVTDDPVTSKYIRKVHRKKGFQLGGLIPPLFFGSLFIAIGVWYYLKSQPSYEGVVEGKRINPEQSIQIEIKGTDFEIDSKIFSQIVDEVRERPSSVRSNLVNLRFSAGAKGLAISLRPGSEADLVQVPISQLEPVEIYYRDHFEDLEEARLDELQAGLKSLAEDWVSAPEGEKKSTLPDYRNEVVYNSFVKGLGRICYAKVGNAMYPCVHEDSQGTLYFLVPIGTKKFLIKERSDLDETPFFPSTFLVEVQIARPKLESAELVPDTEDSDPNSTENPPEELGESETDSATGNTTAPASDTRMSPPN